MYAKIFSQIFDSSIAEDYRVRHVFEDLLKLCDKEGVVDMTPEAVARRTNVPLEEVKYGISELMKPDPRSRSHDHEGRRLILVDSHRDWGWIIVNYQFYRAIQDEESRRAAYRDAKRRQRAKAKVLKNGKPLQGEPDYEAAVERGAGEPELNRIVGDNLPDERVIGYPNG
jgi:hypothetical protein